MASSDWNAPSYQSGCSFVWQFGRDLLTLLAPRAGERILDLGCGTGQLTAEIARSGALTTGIDRSPSMIEQARTNFPELRFEVADVRNLVFHEQFDAVFSNAALHWVPEAAAAVDSIRRALVPGGRFAAEFGGRGNIRVLHDAIYRALAACGVRDPERLNPWYYPGIAEYTSLLESHGFEAIYAVLFDRPTPLEGEDPLSHWLDTFGRAFTDALEPEQRPEFVRRVSELAAPQLLRDGQWVLDYRRLRVSAIRL